MCEDFLCWTSLQILMLFTRSGWRKQFSVLYFDLSRVLFVLITQTPNQQDDKTCAKYCFTSFVLFLNLGSFSSSTIHRAMSVMRRPCPTSPNITANRNGNVMMVQSAIESYRGEMEAMLLCYIQYTHTGYTCVLSVLPGLTSLQVATP